MKTLLRYSLIFCLIISGVKIAGASSIAANIAPSTDAYLSSFGINPASILKHVGASQFNYTASVSPALASVTVNVTTRNVNASVTVNGVIVPRGSASGPVALPTASTLITIVVTAEDGVTKNTFTLTVNKTGSSNAYLSGFTTNPATTVTHVGGSQFDYQASVSFAQPSITIKPTTSDVNATVTVNGVIVPRGSSTGAIALPTATTVINMLVTAEDGVTTNAYTLTINKSGSTNAYLSSFTTNPATNSTHVGASQFDYQASVGFAQNSITITPITADANATVTVNGVLVPRGSASGAIALPTATTVINMQVTAQDGVTTNAYTLTINKTGSTNAYLSSFTTNPATNSTRVGASQFDYQASVGFAQSSITITPTTADANATVTVNGVLVPQGSASGAIALPTATTVINMQVTAQDGVTTNAYTLTINKTGSTNALLSGLATTPGTVITHVGASQFDYQASVSFAQNSVTVTPTTADANATVTVNGVLVPRGSASGAIALPTATTVINMQVTAQDGVTTNAYTLTINKNGSTSAVLSALTTTPASAISHVGASQFDYTSNVSFGTSAISVTPTTADVNATVTVNGVLVPRGSSSAPIALSAVSTVINMLVTAQDGVTTNAYTLTVNRVGATYTWLGTGANTNWSNPNNWSPTGAPVAGDNVLIGKTTNKPSVDQPSVCATVKITGNTTINLLSTLTLSAGLTVDSALTVSGISTLSAPSLQLNDFGTVITQAGSQLAFSTVTILANAQIQNAGSITSSVSLTSGFQSSILNSGTFNSSGSVAVGGNGYISNLSGGTFTLPGATPLSLAVLAHINNAGTFTVNTGVVSMGVSTYISNLAGGTFNVNGASSINMLFQSVIGNSGIFNVTGSVINVGNKGYINNNATGVFTLSGNTTVSFKVDTAALGYILNTGTFYAGKFQSASTLNLDYPGVYVQNDGNFYLGSSSVINLTGYGTALKNTGTFTLQSDSTGSATIGKIADNNGVVCSGIYNVERYISGGSSVYRGYRLISSPVYQGTGNGNNIYSLNYVKLSSFITGPTGTAGGFDKAGNPTLYLFRENIAVSNSTFTGGNYRGLSDISAPPAYSLVGESGTFNIPVANGFYFFFRGDRVNNVANKYAAGTIAESVTLTASGQLNIGPITAHDWYTPASANLGFTNTPGNSDVQGFNLVGNPYPSSIDWNSYNTTTPNSGIYAPNVSNTIYILDPVSKNLGVYQKSTGFSTNNATHIIPSGQGFFVQAFDPTASLTFNEDAKIDSQVVKPHLLLGVPVNNTVSQYLHLKLKQGDAPIDEAFINFSSGAKTQFSLSEDALYRPGNGIGSLASLSSEGYSLSINAQAFPKKSAVIALNVNAVADGTYQISVPDIKSIPKLYDVWLMDAYKKDSLDIKRSPSYSFDIIKSNAESYGINRFSVVIRQNPAYAYRLLSFAGTKVADGVQLVWKTENEGNYTWFTVERSIDNGKNFDVLGSVTAADQGMYALTDKSPLKGLNQYRLKQEDINGAISYSNIVSVQYSGGSSVIANTVNIYPNPAVSNINLSISQPGKASSYEIRIVNNLGAVVKTATSAQPNWQSDVSALLPGTYILQVLNNNDKTVVGKSSFIKL